MLFIKSHKDEIVSSAVPPYLPVGHLNIQFVCPKQVVSLLFAMPTKLPAKVLLSGGKSIKKVTCLVYY